MRLLNRDRLGNARFLRPVVFSPTANQVASSAAHVRFSHVFSSLRSSLLFGLSAGFIIFASPKVSSGIGLRG